MSAMIPASYSTFKPHLQYKEYPAYTEMLDKRMQENSGLGCYTAKSGHITEVCENDSKVLQARNITHEQIADKLEAVLGKAKLIFAQDYDVHLKAIIDDTLCVEYVMLNLRHICPLNNNNNHDTACGKGAYTFNITNLISKKCLMNVSEVHPHMIRNHHYFQGNPPLPYGPNHKKLDLPEAIRVDRIDPEFAIDVLGIQSGIDYKIQSITQNIWSKTYSSSIDQEYLAAARKDHLAAFAPESGEFEAYVLPYHTLGFEIERQFLHIFRHKNSSEEKTFIIDNIMFRCFSGQGSGHTRFEMKQKVGPLLGKGDYLAEKKKMS